jgi:hypothetical protein
MYKKEKRKKMYKKTKKERLVTWFAEFHELSFAILSISVINNTSNGFPL